MGDAPALAIEEAAHEGELEVVWHHVWRAWDVALLEKKLKMGHALVLELGTFVRNGAGLRVNQHAPAAAILVV